MYFLVGGEAALKDKLSRMRSLITAYSFTREIVNKDRPKLPFELDPFAKSK